MAEFTEICKVYKRMCDSSESCSNCPINKVRDSAYTCRYWMMRIDPEAAEKVILDWGKENPVETNCQKFTEVFGFSPYMLSIFKANSVEWLESEYKEPKND